MIIVVDEGNAPGGSLLSICHLCFDAPVDRGNLKSLYDAGHIYNGILTRRGDNLFIFIAEG